MGSKILEGNNYNISICSTFLKTSLSFVMLKIQKLAVIADATFKIQRKPPLW